MFTVAEPRNVADVCAQLAHGKDERATQPSRRAGLNLLGFALTEPRARVGEA